MTGGVRRDVIQSSPSLARVNFLMHHRSSSHENLVQWGMPSLTGSRWPTSATTAAQPPSSLPMLWAKAHRDSISRNPCFPSMCRPYKKYTPNCLKTFGIEGKRSQGKCASRALVPAHQTHVSGEAPLTCSLNTSLVFHTLRIAKVGGRSCRGSLDGFHLKFDFLGTAMNVPKFSLFIKTLSISFGKNSELAKIRRYTNCASWGGSGRMRVLEEDIGL